MEASMDNTHTRLLSKPCTAPGHIVSHGGGGGGRGNLALTVDTCPRGRLGEAAEGPREAALEAGPLSAQPA